MIAGSTRGVELTPYSVQPAGTIASPTHFNTITQNSIDDTTGFGIDFLPFGQVNSPVMQIPTSTRRCCHRP